MPYKIERLSVNPIIHAGLDSSIGTNINGPSLIRVPEWLPNPLGRYYLYFAHHQGTFIRLAYADDLHGPWKIHTRGTLRLEQTVCHHHIASPDVHIDDEHRELVMYFHGPVSGHPAQRSLVAISENGLDFKALPEILGPPYFRVFQHGQHFFAIAMAEGRNGGGILLRSPDGRSAFEKGPTFLDRQRHGAILKKDHYLTFFFSRGRDCPERIMIAGMSLEGDWRSWQMSNPCDLLLPEFPHEGSDRSLIASSFGAIHEPVRQLRDPCVFEDQDRTYLLYSCAGEHAIAIAELHKAPDATTPTEDTVSDILAPVYRETVSPAIENVIHQYRTGRKYRDADFPLGPSAFDDFQRDVCASFSRALKLEEWLSRIPTNPDKSLQDQFQFRSLRTFARDGIGMEAGVIDLPETGEVVPAVICLPEIQSPRPGICVFSGHSLHGLRDLILDLDSYQAGMAFRLARAGFVSIAIEKVDAGYLARQAGNGNDEQEIGSLRLAWGRPTRTHQLMACVAAAEILAGHSRVNPDKIGATGVSLGGWLGVETALLTDRIKAIADFGMKTRHLDPDTAVEDIHGIKDLCHIYPGMLSVCDRNLLALACCPRPMLAGHGRRDTRSCARAEKDYRALFQAQYAALGHGDKYEYHIHNAGDDMPPDAVIDFFQRTFADTITA